MPTLMTTLDLRHPIISAALAHHGVDPVELNDLVLRDGISFDYGDKAGIDIPHVHVGPDRCWVKWGRPRRIQFYLSSPTWVRRGEVRPLQQVTVAGVEFPPSVVSSLAGRSLLELIDMPGHSDMVIAHAEMGLDGLIATLMPYYHIDVEETE